MPRSFLDLLPFETRSQIFRYVLSSPTGLITLSRNLYHQKPIRYKLLTLDESGSEVIKLSFLRTCSQIYKECRDLLWKCNTLNLLSFMHETSPEAQSLRDVHEGISSIDGIPRYESDDETPMFVQLPEEVESEAEVVSFYQSDLMVQAAAYRYSTITKRFIKDILDEMSESKDFNSMVMWEWEIWKKSPDFEDYSITRKNRTENQLNTSYIKYFREDRPLL